MIRAISEAIADLELNKLPNESFAGIARNPRV